MARTEEIELRVSPWLAGTSAMAPITPAASRPGIRAASVVPRFQCLARPEFAATRPTGLPIVQPPAHGVACNFWIAADAYVDSCGRRGQLG